jgi:hypothetical protein
VAERGPVSFTLSLKERDSHEWVSRAGGLFIFQLVEIQIDHRMRERIAILVTDLDLPEEP